MGGSELYAVEHHRERGGTLVVLVHGGMDRSTSFADVLRRLTDVHVLVHDRRGYGRSRHVRPIARSVSEHAADLLDLVAGRPAVVVGHSYGGDIALVAAIERPDLVQAVGAFEAPTPWMPWWPTDTAGDRATSAASPAEAAEAFMRRVVGDRVWERLPARTKAERRAEGEALLAELASIRGGAPFDPAQVQVPVVVGYGTATEAHHRTGSEELLSRLPDGQRFEINGAGHGGHVTHPDAFAAFVRTAIERGTRRASARVVK
jgi:pimeloyl-ACP methyl ester carboxylesterase